MNTDRLSTAESNHFRAPAFRCPHSPEVPEVDEGDGPAEPQGVVDDSDEEEERSQITHVTLSQLLDNVVILEESIKELVAIIHARRSLGIDSIRYL
ncbi:hypothetical protein NUW54_g7533 [Trametes sanguinea]|uniref:Uncharacterized protein n=1 Tax=Trametes sanguinea TaxID=158606 RepID=A0ACC1PJS0_9APHY|nr:hypothetical protein NUW54_g7533 [Trametes sanguinea]